MPGPCRPNRQQNVAKMTQGPDSLPRNQSNREWIQKQEQKNIFVLLLRSIKRLVTYNVRRGVGCSHFTAVKRVERIVCRIRCTSDIHTGCKYVHTGAKI